MQRWYREHGFLYALGLTLSRERGYVNDPNDPGGATCFGISSRAHPDLWGGGPPTLEEAADRYFESYWRAAGCHLIQDAGVAAELFDSAVLHGPTPAVKFLQRALRQLGQPVTIDGKLGPQTAGAANDYPYPEAIRAAQNVYQGAYMTALDPRYFRGWLKRVHVDLED